MHDNIELTRKRKELINSLKMKNIFSDETLTVMENISRELFVQNDFSKNSYDDRALPIICGQTISQPYTVAYMTDALEIRPGDKVLEIGTGSGYQTTILYELGAEVYSIERIKDLFENTRALLRSLNVGANLFWGDGNLGLPEYAPFDSIIVTAAGPAPVKRLMNQLKIGGRMVAPIGDRESQTMFVISRKNETQFAYKKLGKFKFVPLLDGIV